MVDLLLITIWQFDYGWANRSDGAWSQGHTHIADFTPVVTECGLIHCEAEVSDACTK